MKASEEACPLKSVKTAKRTTSMVELRFDETQELKQTPFTTSKSFKSTRKAYKKTLQSAKPCG